MSRLTVRPYTEADHDVAVGAGLDDGILNAKESQVCIAVEKGKPVGVAVGFADIAPRLPGATTPRVARLGLIRSLLQGRSDILLAMVYWHNENAIKTDHVYSEIVIPLGDKQCTNVMPTPALTTFVTARLDVDMVDDGYDNALKQVAAKRVSTERRGLPEISEQLRAALEALGCEVTLE